MNRPNIRHLIVAWILFLPVLAMVDRLRPPLPYLVLAGLGACLTIWALAWFVANRWVLLAYGLSRPRVRDALIARFAVPDRAFPIHGPDGSLYMERFIVFNRGGGSIGTNNHGPVQFPWLPFSIRLHHIVRPDSDRVPHDHPAAFRTIILKGGYEQIVAGQPGESFMDEADTQRMSLGMFHRITWVGKGVWTLVIFGRRKTVWGFLVDGHKVPYDEYLKL